MKNMNYLAQLLIIGSLLDKIEDLGGERLMMKCKWSGAGPGAMCIEKNTPAQPGGKPWG